jgi:hypothetical protein
MDDPALDDIVIFELPSFADVEAFCDRFQPRWAGWSHADHDASLFAARLSATPDDLALLLREAQQLLTELGLATSWYWLDGRLFELEARTPVPIEKAPLPGLSR